MDSKRVSELWGEVGARRAADSLHGWLDSPVVLDEVVGPRQTGVRGKHWLIGLVESLAIPRDGRWLSLGCGTAGTEIFASKEGLFSSLVALDISQGALDVARHAATAQGVSNITFETVDLDDMKLPPGPFDVILMNMSLHHVRNLEGAVVHLEQALNPNGFLLLNEYIGPSQFQFTERQAAITSEILVALGDQWNTDRTTGKPKTLYLRLPKSHWDLVDPSEAIRSSEMLPILSSKFEVVLRRDYGGTLLALVLENIVGNFDAKDKRDAAAMRLLGLIEDLLIRHGILANDFTLVALRRRSSPEAARTSPVAESLPLNVQSASQDDTFLRTERAALEQRLVDTERHIHDIESSKGWKLLQGIRAVFGRKW